MPIGSLCAPLCWISPCTAHAAVVGKRGGRGNCSSPVCPATLSVSLWFFSHWFSNSITCLLNTAGNQLSLVLARNSPMALLGSCSGLHCILVFGSLQIVPLLFFSWVSLFTSSGEDLFWVADGRRRYPSAGQLEDWMTNLGPGFPASAFPVIGGDFQPLPPNYSLKRMLGHLYSKSYSSAKIRFLQHFTHLPREVSSLVWQCLGGVRDLKVRRTMWHYSGEGDNQNQEDSSLAGTPSQQKASLTDRVS